MLSDHLSFLLDAMPAELSRLGEHLPHEWIEQAIDATGTASIRRRRLPAERVVWLVIALAIYRHWSISEVVDSLDLILPNEATFVSKSAIDLPGFFVPFQSWRTASIASVEQYRCLNSLGVR